MDLGLRFVIFLLHLIGILLAPIYAIVRWFQKQAKVPPITDSLLLISVTELAAKIRDQEVKSEEVVRAYIERVTVVNPIINAVIEERFEGALKDAQHADQMCSTMDRAELATKFPLLGVPFTVKESCGLQGFSHAVGSIPRKGRRATYDGTVVAHLKNAGAIPLLVSSNPEFCVSWECNTILNGVCRNPYNSKHSPGGSSGGEGALIGAGASLFGVGSDIAGSIRVPSLFNGIFGHKSTGALLSTNGHFPCSTDPKFNYFLQTGPMCRYAKDLSLLLPIMAGENAQMLQSCNDVRLKDIKFYTTRGYGSKWLGTNVDGEIEEAIQKAISHFRNCGMDVREMELSSKINDSLEGGVTQLIGMEDIPDALEHPDNPKVHDNLFLEFCKHLVGMPKYSLPTLLFNLLKESKGFMTSQSRQLHCEKIDMLRKELLDKLGTDGVLFFPTWHSPAVKHHTTCFQMAGAMFTMMFNNMGFPGTQIPMGLSKQGLPIGFQVVAAPYQDNLCLTVAAELETKFGGWIPPSSV